MEPEQKMNPTSDPMNPNGQTSAETPAETDNDLGSGDWDSLIQDDDVLSEEGSSKIEEEKKGGSEGEGSGEATKDDEASPEQKPEGEAETPPTKEEEAKPEEKPAEPQQPQQPSTDGVQEPAAPQDEQAVWQEWREKARESLQKAYGLSEEEAKAFETDPVAVLPKLAAEVHMNVFDAVYQTLRAQLPAMVEQVQAQQRSRQEFHNAFFERWPELKGLEKDVQTAMNLYAQLNPGVTREQLIEDVGLQVSIRHRKPLPGSKPAPVQQPQVPAAAPAFKPAAPSAVSPSQSPTAGEGDEWAELLNDD